MNSKTQNIWTFVYLGSLLWPALIAGVMSYDTCLKWFANSELEFFKINHVQKTSLLTFTALAIYMLALNKRKQIDLNFPR